MRSEEVNIPQKSSLEEAMHVYFFPARPTIYLVACGFSWRFFLFVPPWSIPRIKLAWCSKVDFIYQTSSYGSELPFHDVTLPDGMCAADG